MATLRTVVKTYEAGKLANAIAATAFEHIIPPIDRELTRIAREAYLDFIGEENLERFSKAKIFSQKQGVVKLLNSEGKEILTRTVALEDTFFGYYYAGVEIPVSAELEAEITPMVENFNNISTQIRNLSRELASQIQGRTIKALLAAWPEATEIIARVMCVDDITNGVSSVATPLSSILTQFLPALASPATASGETKASSGN